MGQCKKRLVFYSKMLSKMPHWGGSSTTSWISGGHPRRLGMNMLLSVDTSTGVPAQVPCGTLSLPSRTSCGWVLACSPWSSDTASPPCCQAPQLLPLLQQCSHLRRRRWLHPRYPGSHGDAGGGYLYDGYSHLDSRWPRRIESRPAPATPGYWPTLSQSLGRCHHLQQSQRSIDWLMIF